MLESQQLFEVEAASLPSPDVHALQGLYREQYAFVWRNARRLGCDDEWVDDAVHEVFLVAARRFAEFEGRAAVRTWLFAVTRRVAARMRRDRARYAKRITNYAYTTVGDGPIPQERSDAGRDLRGLLLKIAEPKRLVFILAELEGMTTSEISETLGLRPGTVHSRLRSARSDLRRLVQRLRASDGSHNP
ncbi:MAG TPA: RNA polymerase sigma factor [Polyangiaceae bacterium]